MGHVIGKAMIVDTVHNDLLRVMLSLRNLEITVYHQNVKNLEIAVYHQNVPMSGKNAYKNAQ